MYTIFYFKNNLNSLYDTILDDDREKTCFLISLYYSRLIQHRLSLCNFNQIGRKDPKHTCKDESFIPISMCHV